MLVVAKAKCFIDGSRRRVGDVFEVKGDGRTKLPSYLEAIKDKDPEVVSKAVKAAEELKVNKVSEEAALAGQSPVNLKKNKK